MSERDQQSPAPSSTEHTLGDAPIEPAYRAQMNAIGDVLHETFNGPNVPISQAKVAFVLMVFPIGQPDGKHRCNYISTANREDVACLLREQLAYFEGMPPSKPGRA